MNLILSLSIIFFIITSVLENPKDLMTLPYLGLYMDYGGEH